MRENEIEFITHSPGGRTWHTSRGHTGRLRQSAGPEGQDLRHITIHGLRALGLVD